MGMGLVAGLIGGISAKKQNKKLQKELANAPKYKVTDEAFNNQALAQGAAFGRDRSIQLQEQNLDQGAANAAFDAKSATNSTSALLNAITKINEGKNQALRGLGQDEAGMQNQKRQQLMGANAAMIDEKDKAWNYNENMPFQMRVAAYRDKIKANQELALAGLSYEAQTSSAFLSSMGGMMSGACDGRIKDNIKPCEHGLEAVMEMRAVEFEYTHQRYNDGRKHIGFIAQEMDDIVPQAVGPIHGSAPEGENDFLKINYNELVPVLVNAIQDQQNQIKILLSRIETLEEETVVNKVSQ